MRKKKFCNILKDKLDRDIIRVGDTICFLNNKWKVIGIYNTNLGSPNFHINEIMIYDKNKDISIDVCEIEDYKKWCRNKKGSLKHHCFRTEVYNFFKKVIE